MKNTLVVVSDLGGFKAYRLQNGELNRTPRLELIGQYHNAGAHGRLVDRVTDLSGRFPRGTGTPNQTGAMSDGERHNIQLELRKRMVRHLAQRLSALLLSDDCDQCFLAASREINRQLLEELDSRVRGKIERNVPADLTKIEKAELLEYFAPPPPRSSHAGARAAA